MTRPVVYAATAQGSVVAGNTSSMTDAFSGLSLAQSKAKQYVGLASSGPVAERVAKSTGISGGSVSATIPDEGTIINFTARADTGAKAAKLADAAVLATRDQALAMEAANSGGRPSESVVRIVPFYNATTPSSPTSPKLWLNVLLGAAAGLVLGYLIVYGRRQIDNKVRHVDDVEPAIHAPVLGVVPRVKQLADQRANGLREVGPAAEALRMLRTNLRFIDVDHPPKSIVITSANPGEGKSTVSSNLARVLAAAGQKVLLIDADLRKPVVAKILDVDGSIGLTQALAGDIDLVDAIQPTDYRNLSVLTAGRIPPNPSELLGSKRMQAIIQELTKEYFVIFDAPPLLPVTDAGLLANHCDGVVMVFYVGKTQIEHAQMSAKVLDQIGARMYGAVLNMAPRRGMGSVIYGYGYGGKNYGGYGYGYGADNEGTSVEVSDVKSPDDDDAAQQPAEQHSKAESTA